MDELEDLVRQLEDALYSGNIKQVIALIPKFLSKLANFRHEFQDLIRDKNHLIEQYGAYLPPLPDDFD